MVEAAVVGPGSGSSLPPSPLKPPLSPAAAAKGGKGVPPSPPAAAAKGGKGTPPSPPAAAAAAKGGKGVPPSPPAAAAAAAAKGGKDVPPSPPAAAAAAKSGKSIPPSPPAAAAATAAKDGKSVPPPPPAAAAAAKGGKGVPPSPPAALGKAASVLPGAAVAAAGGKAPGIPKALGEGPTGSPAAKTAAAKGAAAEVSAAKEEAAAADKKGGGRVGAAPSVRGVVATTAAQREPAQLLRHPAAALTPRDAAAFLSSASVGGSGLFPLRPQQEQLLQSEKQQQQRTHGDLWKAVQAIFDEYRRFVEDAGKGDTGGRRMRQGQRTTAAAADVGRSTDSDEFDDEWCGVRGISGVRTPRLRALEALRVRPHPLRDFRPTLPPQVDWSSLRDEETRSSFPSAEDLRFFRSGFATSDGVSPAAAEEGDAEFEEALQVETYTQIVEAEQEGHFFLSFCGDIPFPASWLSLLIDGRRYVKCLTCGALLCATLPPLSPGRHSLSLCLRKAQRRLPLLLSPRLQAVSSSSEGFRGQKTQQHAPTSPPSPPPAAAAGGDGAFKRRDQSSSLPSCISYVLLLIAVVAPRPRADPLLCYSTARQSRRGRRMCEARATGPYTPEDLLEFMEAVASPEAAGPPAAAVAAVGGAAYRRSWQARSLGPRFDRNGKVVAGAAAAAGDSSSRGFAARLQACVSLATALPDDSAAAAAPPVGTLEALMAASAENCDVRIPLPLKISLFSSCAETSRLAIACFHSKVFEFDPFGVLSAHIFTKSRYNEVYTVFAFSLLPLPSAPQSSAAFTPQPTTPFLASLDRFEATERLCADTRFWSYVDGVAPLKNEEAASFSITDWRQLQCPVPLMLRHAANPLHSYPEGLQIAPGVYLFFEPWPSEVLPMPLIPLEQSQSAAMQAVDRAVESAGGRIPAAEAADQTAAAAAAARKKVAEAAGRVSSLVAGGGGGGEAKAAADSAARSEKEEGERRRREWEEMKASGSLWGGGGPGHWGHSERQQQQQWRTTTAGRGGRGREITVCVSQRDEKRQYFSLTLCVGDHIFSSVMGVEASVLAFIVNQWLFFVPEQNRKDTAVPGGGVGEVGDGGGPLRIAGQGRDRKGREARSKGSSTEFMFFKREEEEMKHLLQNLRSREEAVRNLLPISYAYTGRHSSKDVRQGGLSVNFM